ncbi:DUF1643 domain-containing protein [Sporosarcina sp. ACRSM]|uniref:DUF1643 domain-containing protein n=1 Tax=Sporosarcina sp. ACRSM TaxID=2918216 RepID=UPI001EF66E18|nr:DUF1643 domain-containing protein [Sporosarcina sp. ACRSM]MCG7337162.1 DUF1643 domain-containing protein [Sporosarcina sp. ACRSM]
MITKEHIMKTKAIYSEYQNYRYSLTKIWDEDKPKAAFIGINPSDATELLMDKTVMNLTNYLIQNGYGQVEIVNLFAYRSKKQDGLKNRKENDELHNVEFIRKALEDSQLIIVGWGRDADGKAKYKEAINNVKRELLPFKERVKCFQDKKGHINCHLSMGYSEEWRLVNYPIGTKIE